ncbi:hypothetical protein J2X16_003998 [Pelomonas aquatica]|uniref:Uncharacterized protein n=1 Tax=Pelomonas aquatica TaxID=431058 RepID=A0ABU1ZFB3_9BURK|nr:hypothetical protein [Pelomonas aquatica]
MNQVTDALSQGRFVAVMLGKDRPPVLHALDEVPEHGS